MHAAHSLRRASRMLVAALATMAALVGSTLVLGAGQLAWRRRRDD